MSKLNSQQKNYLKTIESDSKYKKLKKAFKKANEEKEFLDSKKLLKKLFKSLDPNKKKNKIKVSNYLTDKLKGTGYEFLKVEYPINGCFKHVLKKVDEFKRTPEQHLKILTEIQRLREEFDEKQDKK